MDSGFGHGLGVCHGDAAASNAAICEDEGKCSIAAIVTASPLLLLHHLYCYCITSIVTASPLLLLHHRYCYCITSITVLWKTVDRPKRLTLEHCCDVSDAGIFVSLSASCHDAHVRCQLCQCRDSSKVSGYKVTIDTALHVLVPCQQSSHYYLNSSSSSFIFLSLLVSALAAAVSVYWTVCGLSWLSPQ
jgi:hypothetical protein